MLYYALLVTATIMLVPAFADSALIMNVNSYSELNEGNKQIVFGNITDSKGNPLSNVEIQAAFPSRTIMTSTNSSGEFSIQSPISEQTGQYTIPITAIKDTTFAETMVQYTVTEKPTSTQENKPHNERIEIDPFSKMIKQLEQQKQENKQRMQEEKQQESILNERNQAQQNIEKDLEELKKKTRSHSPRNAFLGFLADIDHSVRGLFWQQFLFTEKITNESQKEKQKALDSGKSPLESTKIFQKKAAVSKKDIVEYNKKISTEHGNATLDKQEKFNKFGKIPRN